MFDWNVLSTEVVLFWKTPTSSAECTLTLGLLFWHSSLFIISVSAAEVKMSLDWTREHFCFVFAPDQGFCFRVWGAALPCSFNETVTLPFLGVPSLGDLMVLDLFFLSLRGWWSLWSCGEPWSMSSDTLLTIHQLPGWFLLRLPVFPSLVCGCCSGLLVGTDAGVFSLATWLTLRKTLAPVKYHIKH